MLEVLNLLFMVGPHFFNQFSFVLHFASISTRHIPIRVGCAEWDENC